MIEDKIDISYEDQQTFLPRPKHKYDAEALFLIEDKIAVMSKDRSKLLTDLYLIDKESKNIVFDDEIAKDAAITINGELSEKFKN